MTSTVFYCSEEYTRMVCSECAIVYFFPKRWTDKAREEGSARSWKCPNGHGQCYTESEAEKLRQERDRLKQRVAERDDEIAHQRSLRQETERSLIATKGHLTRGKKRAAAGTCPCCQRTFGNMAEHMKRQHPQFVADSGANVTPIKRAGGAR